MANKRQRKKAAKKAKLEIERKRLEKETLENLGLSTSEKMVVDKLVQKTLAEEAIVDQEVDKEMDKEADKIAASIKVPVVPPVPASKPFEPAAARTASAGAGATSAKQEPKEVPEAPKTKSLFDRAAEGPKSLASMFATAIGNIRIGAPTPEQKKTRADIVKINNQLILTTKIIDANKDELTKMAKTDSSIAKILEVSGSDQLKEIKNIQNRILAGEEISKADSQNLIKSLEEVTGTISSTKVSLEAKFSDVLGNFQALVLNNDMDRDDRRAMLEELVKISKSEDLQAQFSDEQKKSLAELEALSNSNLNFTDEQNKSLNGIFNQLKSEDLDRIKLKGTLDDLNESMESSLLTNDELKKKLDTKDDKGNTLREKAGEGIHSLGKTLKAGAIDFALSKVGLGGLGIGEMLGDVGLGGIGTAVSGGLGLLGKIPGVGKLGQLGAGLGGKLLGGVGGKIGGVLGKAALPLALLQAGYGAYKGVQDADNIAGVKEGEHASLSQKVGAGAAGAASSLLTLGFVDPKTIYEGVGKGMKFLFDPEDGVLTKTASFFKKAFEFTPLGMIIAHFDMIKKGFGLLFGEEGIVMKMAKFWFDLPNMMFDVVKELFTDPASLVEKVKNSFGMIFDFLFGEEGIFSLHTARKALASAAGSILPEFLAKRIGATPVEAVPTAMGATVDVEHSVNRVNSSAADLATNDERRARSMREEQLTASKDNKTIIVPAPVHAPQTQTSRTSKIDDLGLAVMNAGMAGI